MPSASWYCQIHERILDEDPIAPAELAEGALEPLTRALTRKYPSLRRDLTLIADAVTDSLVGYLKQPGKFDPTKRGLFGYLLMAAEGDLRNALAKQSRRQDNAAEDVEVAAAGGKVLVAEARDVVAELHAEKVQREIEELFDDPRDREMVELILDGERSTDAFAAVLGIGSLSIAEQRSEVKRHKDRIKKRLRDYGQRNRHENH